MLNLPTTFPKTSNTMYLGIGGGYDILGAIPIHEAIQSESVFVNVSTGVNMLCDEPYKELDPRHGAFLRATELDEIVKKYEVDTIIAVDGGVDCLMHGDEENSGTVLQDFITLAALDNLKCPLNILVACVGFGCESEENMNHYAVLENIAQLIRENAFLGSCSLIGDDMSVYKNAVENWSNQRKSHIQTRVIAAVEGQFGYVHSDADANLSQAIYENQSTALINPLMSIYWFFQFAGIAKNNKILPVLKNARTLTESLMEYRKAVTRTRTRKDLTL